MGRGTDLGTDLGTDAGTEPPRRGPIGAGVGYFLPVFAFAFAIGVVRTLVVAPRVGDVIAVGLELPLVLGCAWAVCRRVARRVAPGVAARAIMGATAFALLMTVEFVMATALFGRAPAQWLAALGTPAGLLGLAGQVGFGVMPLFVRRR